MNCCLSPTCAGNGRFASADTLVPDPASPQAFNRYAYGYNNPLRYRDSDGHRPCELVCPGDRIPTGSFTGSAWYGSWNVQQQRQNAEKAEALLVETRNTTVGIVWEPADWAIAFSDGFHWYDGLGMLPLIPASLGDNLGRFIARHGGELVQSIRLVDNATFRPFTYRNLRENLSRLTGFMPTNDFEAHHVLPDKFADRFARAGFVGENSIHNPMFGSWVPKSDHQSWTRAYQDRWTAFFEANDNPSMEQILNFSKNLAEEYGFDVYFP